MNRAERRRLEREPGYQQTLASYNAAASAAGDRKPLAWASMVYGCDEGHEQRYFVCVGVESPRFPNEALVREYPSEWVPSPMYCGQCRECGGAMFHVRWWDDAEWWPPTEVPEGAPFFRLPTLEEAREYARQGYGGAHFVKAADA